MNKKDGLSKKDKRMLVGFLASPIILGVIIAGLFEFNFDKNDWIDLIISCFSIYITIFLGYMVYFQTENHKLFSYLL